MHHVQGAIVTRRTSKHIIAECFNGSHREAVNFALSNNEKHARAAAALVRKLAIEWHKRGGNATKGRELINAPQCGQWIAGDMPSGEGFAFTYAGDTDRRSGIDPRGFVQNCELADF